MFLEPLGDISVDRTIFGLGKQTPLTIQILALHIMAPKSPVNAVWVDEGIKQDANLVTKARSKRISLEQSFYECLQG